MKKSICAALVLGFATAAMAVPAFVLPAEIEIDVTKGEFSKAVTLEGKDFAPAGIGGMVLVLACETPGSLSDLVVKEGTVWTGNSQGWDIYTEEPNIFYVSVNTLSFRIMESGVLATFVVSVPEGTAPGTTFKVSTDAMDTDWEMVSSFGNIAGIQADMIVHITPEPASALLLLAALPLIRRRK